MLSHYFLERNAEFVIRDRMAEAERERLAASAVSGPRLPTMRQVLEPWRQRMLSFTRRIWSTQASTT